MLNNQKNYKSTQSNVNEKYYNSWRTDVVEVEPNGVTDHAFLTTKPNLIYIKNPNNTYLYFGLKAIPTPDKYEFQILPHSYDTFGQPNGTGHLYIYNPTPNKLFIEVYSQYDEFNIAILKNYSLAVNEVKVQGEFEYKAGYQLPSGTNTIGRVELNKDVDYAIKQLNSIKQFFEDLVSPNVVEDTTNLKILLHELTQINSNLITLNQTIKADLTTLNQTINANLITLNQTIKDNAIIIGTGE